ncbi:type III toxin-antitoxin system CptIN family toxin [Sinanaerobacter sp. ZZT-01]|uniref:type III toxin-antitoxin system CptIN family toxin n=1 Tax=Sinanaerobacter sp. ZZT-01 TaxID=3111540 RepID=UPI002D776DEA|nr:hypothetical protein [Sinanaerobacter sp. ZZT-01]WRR94227.1 hypothetical protein U5921_03660 [Sinanaerobacter sp. ZZT-01]
MELVLGRLYFLPDSFFNEAKDPYLKHNKISGARPHYLALLDQNGLCWMVPCSSQIDKYKAIIHKKEEQHKEPLGIQIVKIKGISTVLLFQDMFPVRPEEIKDYYHRKDRGPMELTNRKLVEKLHRNAEKVISMLRSGIHFTPTQPDVIKIEKHLLLEIQREKEEGQKRPSLDQQIERAFRENRKTEKKYKQEKETTRQR